MKRLIIFMFMLFAVLFLFAAENPDAILGVWKNGTGKGHIQIYKQNGKYFGKIIWLRDSSDDNGKPKVDRKNADPDLRNKPLIGLVMLKDFVYDGDEWKGGRIYNPSDGKIYRAYMKMQDYNTLLVHGYIGFTWFGKSDIWTRVR